MNIRLLAATLLALGLGMATLPASAGFIEGAITMSSDFLPTGGTGLADATGVDFVGDDFDVDGTTADFAAAGIAVGDAGTIFDFDFGIRSRS